MGLDSGLVTVLCFCVLGCVSGVFGYVILRFHHSTLLFLEKNMQVGGQPVELVKEQQQVQLAIQKEELERVKELRAQRAASLGD